MTLIKGNNVGANPGTEPRMTNLDLLELTDEQWWELVEYRGGCRCAVSPPPCGNCSEPITEDEAECLGFIDELVELFSVTLVKET